MLCLRSKLSGCSTGLASRPGHSRPLSWTSPVEVAVAVAVAVAVLLAIVIVIIIVLDVALVLAMGVNKLWMENNSNIDVGQQQQRGPATASSVGPRNGNISRAHREGSPQKCAEPYSFNTYHPLRVPCNISSIYRIYLCRCRDRFRVRCLCLVPVSCFCLRLRLRRSH